MSNTHFLVAALVCATAIHGAAAGQERRTSGAAPYDPAGEQTLSARIVDTQTIEPEDGMRLLLVKLTRDGRTFFAVAAPPDWIEKQRFAFTKDATVEVTGLPGGRFGEHPSMLARKFTIGTLTLEVRDAAGKPNWEKKPGQR